MSSLVEVEVPTKKDDSSSDEDRSGSGVEDALFLRYKKFSFRLRRLEIRFFAGAWVVLVPGVTNI